MRSGSPTHEQLLHVRVGTQSMTVRSEARDRVDVASRVTLSIDPSRMLLFDPRTTLALDAGT